MEASEEKHFPQPPPLLSPIPLSIVIFHAYQRVSGGLAWRVILCYSFVGSSTSDITEQATRSFHDRRRHPDLVTPVSTHLLSLCTLSTELC